MPLSAPARQLLSEIQREQISKHPKGLVGQFVFPSRRGDTGYRTELKGDWKQLCKAANIAALRIHDLRHSYASQLASAGVPLHTIGALLGHTQPQTTHRYAHLFDDPLRAATEKVGAIVIAAGSEQPTKEPVKLPRQRGH